MLREINTDLSHQKRFIRLLITGLVALVSLIVTATTAAISLSQSVQTTHYVNEMSKNISLALRTQEDIDRKLEQKLDALYEMVQYLSEEVQGLKIRSCLECHVEFYWICVIAKEHKDSIHGWDKIRSHVKGIWYNANVSLDLLELHKEIQAFIDAKPLNFDAAKTAEDQLRSLVPLWSMFKHLAISVLIIGIGVLLVLCLLPTLVKCFVRAILNVQADFHHVRLRALS